MGLSWDEERRLLPRRSRGIRPHRRPRGFPVLRVSDRALAIARALQARTWAERFHDPQRAVVEDSGGYRGTLGARTETLSRQGNSYGTPGPRPWNRVDVAIAVRLADGAEVDDERTDEFSYGDGSVLAGLLQRSGSRSCT
jgi:hypothetical protein